MDLELADRVYVVTGGARGLGRATLDVLVAEGARAVVSGRSAESLAEVVDAHGDAVVTVVADNADADDARAPHRGRTGAVGTPRRRPDQRRRPAGRPGDVHHRRPVARRVRVGVPRRGQARPGDRCRAGRGRSHRDGAVDERTRTRRQPQRLQRAPARAWPWSPRRWPTSSGRAAYASTDCCPAASAPSGSPSSTRRPGTPRRPRAGCSATIPLGRYGEPEEFGRAAAFLLSPAASFVTGVDAAGRRRHAPGALTPAGPLAPADRRLRSSHAR